MALLSYDWDNHRIGISALVVLGGGAVIPPPIPVPRAGGYLVNVSDSYAPLRLLHPGITGLVLSISPALLSWVLQS